MLSIAKRRVVYCAKLFLEISDGLSRSTSAGITSRTLSRSQVRTLRHSEVALFLEGQPLNIGLNDVRTLQQHIDRLSVRGQPQKETSTCSSLQTTTSLGNRHRILELDHNEKRYFHNRNCSSTSDRYILNVGTRLKRLDASLLNIGKIILYLSIPFNERITPDRIGMLFLIH